MLCYNSGIETTNVLITKKETQMELYKKYRPSNLKRVVGNTATVKSLTSKLEKGNLPHFILLSGPSGCGKTTLARIIKNELGCSNSDFYEINCANRNGVELAREIESKFKFKSITGGKRVWLLDEVHNLTANAAQSLLKPLEDTPDHVYFIFATTDPQKVIKTIKTRATEYKVVSLKDKELEKLLKRVCKKEKMDVSSDVIEEIILNCNGSARMALVLLDKVKGLDENEQIEIVQQAKKEEAQAYEILRVLMGWDRGGWNKCSELLNNINTEPEGVRRYLLAACSNQLLKPNKGDNHTKAFNVLCCLEKPLYDLGKPGLIMACYEAINGE